jgi:hypothetical protein
MQAGTWAIYEATGKHLVVRDGDLNNKLVQLDLLIREKELVDIMISKNGLTIELKERMDNVINIDTVVSRLPNGRSSTVERELSCDHRQLYEVIVNKLKNAIVSIKKRRAIGENETGEYLISRVHYIKSNQIKYLFPTKQYKH